MVTNCPHCGCHLTISRAQNTPAALKADVWVSAVNTTTAAAQIYGVPVSEILGRRRARRMVKPRQLAMAALRELGYSFPEIGGAFQRDHSTAQYACRVVAAKYADELALVVDRARLLGRPGFARGTVCDS